MKIEEKTILIAGGSAGIGLEMAKLFASKGCKVIITGRDKNKLQKAAAELKGVEYTVANVDDEVEMQELAVTVRNKYPELSLAIYNAGYSHVYPQNQITDIQKFALQEMTTNYLSALRFTELMLPILSNKTDAALVYVTSVAAFATRSVLLTYGASKAALHSFLQNFRIILERTSGVKLFELMPPLVNTEFSKEIGGYKGIPPAQVAEELWNGLVADVYEIHVAGTADLYRRYMNSPEDAFRLVNLLTAP